MTPDISSILVRGTVAPLIGSGFDETGWEDESMLLDPNGRFFVRHELKIKSFRDRGKPLQLRTLGEKVDVENIIESAIAEGTATFPLKDDDAIAITALDVRPKENIAVLLFRRSDPNATPPVFENIKTKKLRPSDKKDDEAEAISAHVFINLTERETPHPTYRVVIEEVPGLGRSFLQSSLQAIVRECKYMFRDERGETKDTYAIPWLDGIPSETIGGALAGGSIKYVELVRPPKLKGLDMEGLVGHPERMRLTVQPTSKRGILAALERVRSWATDHDWPNVRVQVADSDDRTRVVDIARGADAADVLFVHSEHVTTEKPLLQCTDKINEELVKNAQEIFAKKWK